MLVFVVCAKIHKYLYQSILDGDEHLNVTINSRWVL